MILHRQSPVLSWIVPALDIVKDVRSGLQPSYGTVADSPKGLFMLPTAGGSFRRLAPWPVFSLHDLEALMNGAFEAKEWITARTLKR